MPHSGPHFLRFWCDLVPKSSILRAPWRPAGPKMAPKIAQVAPKVCKKVSGWKTFWGSSNQFAPKVAFGAFLGTISSDFWWILTSVSRIFQNFNQILRINLGHRFTRRPKQASCFIARFYQNKCKDLITKWIHFCFQYNLENAKNRQELTKAKRQRTQTSELHITARRSRN